MMNLFLCLLAPGGDAATDALDRYVALRRKAPALDVVYRSGGLKATLILEPAKRMRLEAKANGLDYLCVVTPSGTRELDRVDREYDALPHNVPGTPRSRVSSAGETFPAWVLAPNMRKVFPPKARFVSLGRRTVGKVTGDAVKGSYRDEQEGSTHNLEVIFGADGAPLHVLSHGQTPMGGYRREWNIDRFRPIPTPADRLFTFALPDGFSPFSLDLIDGPIGVGKRFPLQGWTSASGGTVNFSRRLPKGGLIAILSADSEPSRRAATALGRIKSAGTPVLTLGDAKGVPGVEGYDANGRLIEALSVPSTPVFFKVDGQGKISAVWLGFDPAKAGEFVKEATGR